MEALYEYNNDKKIVVVRITGKMITEEIAPISLEARMKAKKLDYNLLFDFRKSTYLESIVDAYKWFADHYDGIDPNVKFIPTVHIINEKDKEFFQFIETTFSNRGAKVKYFMEESEGIEWLETLK